MSDMEQKKQQIRVCFVLLFLSLVCHLFCNIFSPILQPQLEPDQMMFYMAGKAWMNGLIPYVDFKDVKGPLLWLFYGVGYLITPNKTGGLYLLFSISTTFTLWYIYKTGRAINLSHPASLFACSLTLFALFNQETKGGRAEDLMHPFIAASLYYYICYLMNKRALTETKCDLNKVAWSTGLCISTALLSKYNNIIIGCGIVGIIFMWECKNGTTHRFFIQFLPRLLGSILLLLAPFCLILAYNHALDDCIQTYFILNSKTSSFVLSTDGLERIVKFYSHSFQNSLGVVLIITAFLLACMPRLFPGKEPDFWERSSILLLLLICWIPNSIVFAAYYLIVGAPFFAFTAFFIAKQLNINSLRTTLPLICCILCAVITFNGIWATRCPRRLTQKMSEGVSAIEKELQSIPSPKIIYYSYTLDRGLGLAAGALPGCPFWSRLNGILEMCRKEQDKSIKARTPDFIICTTFSKNTIEENTVQFFKQHGYEERGCYLLNKEEAEYATLYARMP